MQEIAPTMRLAEEDLENTDEDTDDDEEDLSDYGL